jgi:acyl carrier protein
MKMVTDRSDLERALKELVIDECDKDVEPDEMAANAPLIGLDSPLELDSLDALQIALAVKDRYGVRIEGGRQTRQAFQSISSLADYILAN